MFNIIHSTHTVHMAPYMLYTLLPYGILEKVDDTTYKVRDEHHYWKVITSLT
jgi:hypothetical protein